MQELQDLGRVPSEPIVKPLIFRKMKTSRIFTMALCAMVVAMGATSCKKDNNGNAGDRMIIGASISQNGDNNAKTEIGAETGGGFPILWSENDSFTLYSKNNTNGQPFGIASGAGSENGTFAGANPGDAPYFASYPTDVTRTDTTTFIYNIPQEQATLNHAGPMVGYSADGQSASFENAASWVRIGLKGNAKVTKVELMSKPDDKTITPLFGPLYITVGEDGKIQNTEVRVNKSVPAGLSKTYTTPVELKSTEYTYFDFLVPEGAFGDGPREASFNAAFVVYGTGGAKLVTIGKNIPAVERNMVYVGTYDDPINDAAPSYTFTVNADGKTVTFAPGNLYYDGSSFNFEANQWDCRTYAGHGAVIDGTYSATGTPSGHWGLFGWSTENIHYGLSTSTQNADYSGAFYEWGSGPGLPDAGVGKNWRTLNKVEWVYLINTRVVNLSSGFGNTCVYAEVNGVVGLIIFHDGYTGPTSGLTSIPAGCVFLPAAGWRNGSDNFGDWNQEGYYWSSTKGQNGAFSAYNLYFKSAGVNAEYDTGFANYGFSVRLVYDND